MTTYTKMPWFKVGDRVLFLKNSMDNGMVRNFATDDHGIPRGFIEHGSTIVDLEKYSADGALIVDTFKEFFIVRYPSLTPLGRKPTFTALGFTADQLVLFKSANNNTPMYNPINDVAAEVLDADTKELVRAGYLGNDLSLTDRAKYKLWALLFTDKKAVLVEDAKVQNLKNETRN